MEQTLQHFPTLEVTISRASAAERAAETAPDEPDMNPVHLKLTSDAPTTACGLDEDEVTAWTTPDVFKLTDEGSRCPLCSRVRA